MNGRDKTLKPKKCKACKEPFTPWTSMAKVCSPKCAQEHVETERRKKENRERKEGLRKLKTRSEWLKDAQAIFNRYIRERDAKEACISCGAVGRESWDAGHYRSVGAAPQLRFHEDNCHKQCIPCNQHKSGNAVEYRIGLCRRLGVEKVEALEQSNEIKRYSIDDAKEIIRTYKAKLNSLRAEERNKHHVT